MNELITDVLLDNFETEVIQAGLPVLIDFWAPWCGPCLALAPTLDKAANDFQGKVKVVKINVDHGFDISAKYGVRGIPALILLNNGEEIDRLRTINPSSLYTFLNEHVGVETAGTVAATNSENDSPPQPELKAFQASASLKAELVARAELLKHDNKLTGFTGRYVESSDRGSAICWLLRSGEIAKAQSALGFPVSVAGLYEGLYFNLMDFNFVDGVLEGRINDAARPWLSQWLSSIAVGADLSALPSLFIVRLVSKLLQKGPILALPIDDEQINTLALLSRHHENFARGEHSSADEVTALRARVRAITKNRSDPWSHTLANFISKAETAEGKFIGDAVLDLLLGYRVALDESLQKPYEVALHRQIKIEIARIKTAGTPINQELYDSFPETIALKKYLDEPPQVERARHVLRELFKLTEELHNDLIEITASIPGYSQKL